MTFIHHLPTSQARLYILQALTYQRVLILHYPSSPHWSPLSNGRVGESMTPPAFVLPIKHTNENRTPKSRDHNERPWILQQQIDDEDRSCPVRSSATQPMPFCDSTVLAVSRSTRSSQLGLLPQYNPHHPSISTARKAGTWPIGTKNTRELRTDSCCYSVHSHLSPTRAPHLALQCRLCHVFSSHLGIGPTASDYDPILRDLT